jgi:hypothetical protein
MSVSVNDYIPPHLPWWLPHSISQNIPVDWKNELINQRIKSQGDRHSLDVEYPPKVHCMLKTWSQSGAVVEHLGRGPRGRSLGHWRHDLEGNYGTPAFSSFFFPPDWWGQWFCSDMCSQHNVLPHIRPQQWVQTIIDWSLQNCKPK